MSVLRIGRRGVWIGCALLLAAGCTVGPRYEAPVTEEPPGFQPTAGASASEPALVDWWGQLHDPVLSELLRATAAQNLNVQEAEARLRQARALRRVSASALWPHLGSNAGYARLHLSQQTGVPPSQEFQAGLFNVNQDLYQAGFDAVWELDVFGGTRRSVQSADARTEAAIEDRRDILLSVLAETARNYVEIRGAQRQLAVAEENVELQSRTLKLVQDKQSKGAATELEVRQVKAQLERTQSDLPQLETAIRAGAYRIAVINGQPPAALLDMLLQSKPLPGAPDIVPVGLPSDLLRRRPDLRRAERQLAAATADIGVATADLYPKFSLSGDATLLSGKFTELFRSDSLFWLVHPGISWPVFQAGRIKANVAASEARRDEAVTAYRRQVLNAVEEVDEALVRYAQQQIESQRLAQAHEDQARATDLARLQYESGTRDLLTLLDAQRRLYEIDDRLSSSQTGALDELISLYKALGGGWEKFDPDAPSAPASTEKAAPPGDNPH